jgi:predicted Na+-dependent transporter
MKIGEKNVGMIDHVSRIILGIILLYLFAVNMVASPWSYLVAVIGLILLVTGIIGTCLIYRMLGMNTLAKRA